jgi:DNA-directed RNA polymerase specialized sigma24 family protein
MPDLIRDPAGRRVRITGSSDAAHDVYQEVFLAVYRMWDTFTDATNLPGYLHV